MTVRLAINGFGRIGRNILRAIHEAGRDDVQVVGLNDLGPVDTNAHLLKYDSVHGPFRARYGQREFDRHRPRPDQGGRPSAIRPSCRGASSASTWRSSALASSPSARPPRSTSRPARQGADLGAGGRRRPHRRLRRQPRPTDQAHTVVSNASCTTNCLAPVAKVAHDAIGIESGYMTTVHAVDRRPTGARHAAHDLRRARAAGMSMIPTSTGAARAVGLVLPELKGRLDGTSIRVPTPNVSMIDLAFVAKRPTSVEEIKRAHERRGEWFVGRRDGGQRRADGLDRLQPQPGQRDLRSDPDGGHGRHAVPHLAWYDNEWGFSNRMSDVAALLGSL